MINLTDEEMRRFANYCEQEGQSYLAMAEQMEKIKTPLVMINFNKQKAAAFLLIAAHLSSAERVTI